MQELGLDCVMRKKEKRGGGGFKEERKIHCEMMRHLVAVVLCFAFWCERVDKAIEPKFKKRQP